MVLPGDFCGICSLIWQHPRAGITLTIFLPWPAWSNCNHHDNVVQGNVCAWLGGGQVRPKNTFLLHPRPLGAWEAADWGLSFSCSLSLWLPLPFLSLGWWLWWWWCESLELSGESSSSWGSLILEFGYMSSLKRGMRRRILGFPGALLSHLPILLALRFKEPEPLVWWLLIYLLW